MVGWLFSTWRFMSKKGCGYPLTFIPYFDNCTHLLKNLVRKCWNIKSHGNYWRLWPKNRIHRHSGHSFTFIQVPYICISTISNVSKATGPVVTRFHIQPSWDNGTKIDGPGHTNVATTPIYGTNIRKKNPHLPTDRWHWNLVCSIWYIRTIKIVKMMSLSFTKKRSNRVWCFYFGNART